jgi:putative tryptophan/tyrosine transport system substrate-binding protein
MRRREFIAGLGGVAAWPVVARAQQGDRVRRVGVFMAGDENDPEQKHRLSAFAQALSDLGWTDGRNVRVDLRWGAGGLDIDRMRALAKELVGFQPDVIVTVATPPTVAVQRETRTIPIVFANVGDPVASGIVARLDRPNGNVTGFAIWEGTLGGKWLELLLEIAPGLKRAAVMFNPDTSSISTFMPFFQTAARSLKVEPIAAPVHTDTEIETAIASLGASDQVRDGREHEDRQGARPDGAAVDPAARRRGDRVGVDNRCGVTTELRARRSYSRRMAST